MTQNDNFRYYYGQSLINKDTVSEYESILDYITTHGGHGSNIDADKLDGHESTEFIFVGDDVYMPPGFYIGYTPILNQPDEGFQFLGSRDIQLNGIYQYMFDENGLNAGLKIETFYNELSVDPTPINIAKTNYIGNWENDHTNNLLNAGLVDLELAINCVLEYGKARTTDLQEQITALIEKSLSENDLDDLHYILDHYLVEFRTYDEDGNLTDNTEKVLDAGAVNGLRFFLVTQQQYDEYPAPIREDPRYVFIIKDDVPEEYITPTTISASSFKPLFKTDGNHIMVSINGGATYYIAGNIYQFAEDEDGLIPMYVGDNTLPTLLTDTTILGDNFFINGLWMREFLGSDPNTTNTLEDIIDQQIAGLENRMETLIDNKIANLNQYELTANKLTDTLTASSTQYPSSYVVKQNVQTLEEKIQALEDKIGQIDTILTNILGTGTD